jgi:7,8-dihydropterin-6-yl-methyl-4-(beta-D-ribofuranosyl)aminobenzene 5'-phosphate synthase
MKREFLAVFLLVLGSSGVPALGQEVSIINLYDAFGHEKEGVKFDWGYSALIRYNGKTILFDAGNSGDTLTSNASALGVDLRKVDLAILSHRDNDHAAGFDYLLKIDPEVDLYLPNDDILGAPSEWTLPKSPTGVPPEQAYFRGQEGAAIYDPGDRFLHANTQFIGSTQEIAPGIFLIPTYSKLTGDFSKYPPNDQETRFWGLPELSLALLTDEGVVVVVGCSHSGVENIVAKVKDDLEQDVALIIGGFHLLPYETEKITQVAKTLKGTLGVKRVAPAHCTGSLAFKIFGEVYGDDYLFAGLGSKVSLGNSKKK